MSGILRLESLTKGNTLKQGDKTPLKYRLFDADGEKLNIAGKSAKVRLVYPDFLTIGYEKDGLTVAQDDTVTFTIDKVIPSKLYHVEIIVDNKFIFPSREEESKFTVDKSSLGTDANIIEIVGVDAVARKATGMMKQDEEFIDDMTENIISDSKVQSFAQGIDAKATNALDLSKSADTLSKSVQEQFNQVVIDGDSSVEAAQARVDTNGQTNPTLKARLDKEHNEVTTQLAQRQSVNYESFRDGIRTDSQIIKATHEYANANNLPVVNAGGEYWLTEPENIPIETDTDWGSTVFHIDESKYNANTGNSYFVIPRSGETTTVPSSLYDVIRVKLNQKKDVIDELSPYRNRLIVVIDDNQKVSIREGSNATSGLSNRDFYYVDEGGKLIGDKSTELEGITKILAYHVPDNYLMVRGGTFKFNGEKPNFDGYVQSHILCYRSKVRFIGQSTYMEDGVEDVYKNNDFAGFYTLSEVYDIEFDLVDLIPRQGGGTGSYGVGGSVILKLNVRNMVSESNDAAHGIFGLNFVKDARLDNCHINRFDTHYRIWNLTIRDTVLGSGGLQVTGGGLMLLENVTSYNGWSYINLRSDYGAFWKGEIKVINGTSIINENVTTVRLLDSRPAKSHSYGERLSIAEKITVDGFKFEYLSNNDTYQCLLLTMPSSVSPSDYPDGRITFPDSMRFKDVRIIGRNRGITLFSLGSQNLYRVTKKGGVSEGKILTNCEILFDNVDVESHFENTNSNASLRLLGSDTDVDEYVPVPQIDFVNISNVTAIVTKWRANLAVNRSTVKYIDVFEPRLGSPNIFNGINFKDCKLELTLSPTVSHLSALDVPGALFENTTIMAPVIGGEKMMGDAGLAKYQILFTKSGTNTIENINHAHLMTKISPEFFDSTSLVASAKYTLLNNLR